MLSKSTLSFKLEKNDTQIRFIQKSHLFALVYHSIKLTLEFIDGAIFDIFDERNILLKYLDVISDKVARDGQSKIIMIFSVKGLGKL